jgi:hypothetical protein
MPRSSVCLVTLLCLAGVARAWDTSSLPAHPPPVGFARAKALRQEEDQVRQRANALQARSEELWDLGKYDRADELQDQADALLSQARMLEARARAAELSPGIPTTPGAVEP